MTNILAGEGQKFYQSKGREVDHRSVRIWTGSKFNNRMNYKCPLNNIRCGLTTRKTSVKQKNRKNWRFRAIMEVFLTNIYYFYQHNKIYISKICSKVYSFLFEFIIYDFFI